MSDIKGSTSSITDSHALHKELDEASCPICMDHPHNAVLLLCSAHEKGCRSFICDTSYRHSNCLDRFKKLRVNHRNSLSHEYTSASGNSENDGVGQLPISSDNITNDLTEVQGALETQDMHGNSERQSGSLVQPSVSASDQGITPSETVSTEQPAKDTNFSLACPLCRGVIVGWKIEKEARQYLDSKKRSCSHESCPFIGNYQELRRHARRVHPTKSPADIDPSRVRQWQNLEHQRDYGDIMSVIRSSMPNAVVFGDYVIDNEFAGDNESGSGQSSWWSTFVLFQMVNRNSSRRVLPQHRGRSGLWTRQRRPSRDFSSRRRQWGESSLRQEDNWNRSNRRSDDPSPRPFRRRRFNNYRPDENQQ